MEGGVLRGVQTRRTSRSVLCWLLLGTNASVIFCRSYEYALGFPNHGLRSIREGGANCIFLSTFHNRLIAYYLGLLLAIFIYMVGFPEETGYFLNQ